MDFPPPKASSRAVSLSERLLWGGFTLLSLLGLAILLILPLGWREQAVFSIALILIALILGRASRAPAVPLTLMAISVFSTLRYGYWRTTQTWDGVTSAGHLYQWDTVFVVLLLLAEFYAFLTLVLGYFQTLRPLGRQPVALEGDPQSWPSVDVLIPTYNEPLAVVRATVLGALAMDYPANKIKVFVLDDGRREEFRQFAASVGVGLCDARGQCTREGRKHQPCAGAHERRIRRDLRLRPRPHPFVPAGDARAGSCAIRGWDSSRRRIISTRQIRSNATSASSGAFPMKASCSTA